MFKVTQNKLTTWIFLFPEIRSIELGFAIGSFHTIKESKVFYHFFRSEQQLMISTMPFIQFMIDTLAKRIGIKNPLGRIHYVFVKESYGLCHPFTGLFLCSINALHDKMQIDQKLENIQTFSWSFSYSWMRHIILLDSLADLWIIYIFAAHFQDFFERKVFGQNEIEYRRTKYRIYLPESGPCSYKKGFEPLYSQKYQSDALLGINNFMKNKSGMVLKIFTQFVGIESFEKIVRKLMSEFYTNKIKLWSTDLVENRFINTFGEKISDIFTRHVYNGWFPHFRIIYSWSKSFRHIISTERLDRKIKNTESLINDNIDCNLKLTFYEIEGNYEDFVKVERKINKLQYPSQSQILNENLKKNIKINTTSMRFLRVDSSYDFISYIDIFQYECHSIEQLESKEVREVKSQLEAIKQLRMKPYQMVSNALLNCLKKKNYFWRVRLAAADALTSSKNQRIQEKNYNDLIKFFKSFSLYKKKNIYLKKKVFKDLKDYLLQRHFIHILAKCIDPEHYTKIEVIDLIIELLDLNVNIGLSGSDSDYVADLLFVIGEFKTLEIKKREKFVDILYKYLNFDYLISSHRFIISRAALLSFAKLKLNEEIKYTPNFLKYIQSSEPSDIRITAFECLCRLAVQDKTLISTLLHLIKKEKNPFIRLEFIQTWHRVWEQFLYFYYYKSQINLEQKKKKKKNRSNEKLLYFSAFVISSC